MPERGESAIPSLEQNPAAKEQPAEFIELIVGEHAVDADTDEVEILDGILLIPKDSHLELPAEEPIGLPEVIALEESEDGQRNRPEPESAFSELAMSLDETEREADGVEAEMSLPPAIESYPGDIYAGQDSAVLLEPHPVDLLSLLAESVDGYQTIGDGSLDEVLEEITSRLEAISFTDDIETEGSDVYRFLDTETSVEQEAAEDLEELEKLFTLLIETVSTENSRQLVKLYVRLAAAQAESGGGRFKEGGKPAADGDGTHEAIRQLILTLRSMSGIQDRLRHIGDSAIRLFVGFNNRPGSKRLLQVV